MHVFVYGGEYNAPFGDDLSVIELHEPANLGVSLERRADWKGYEIKDIVEIDPDFYSLDGRAIYSPLSERVLSISGQKSVAPGDVIVGINGESVMSVPDIQMLLRGMAGESVRLEVLRLASRNAIVDIATPVPIVAVPLSAAAAAANLQYELWEWRTRDASVSFCTPVSRFCNKFTSYAFMY